jgi:S-adenosylmethionine:tRNA ribosyltransferase-isomerase
MPSAARPFTFDLVTRLVNRDITHHCPPEVTSAEVDETPYPERFLVGEHTAAMVNCAHTADGRHLAASDRAAISQRYLWHAFGDVHLIV